MIQNHFEIIISFIAPILGSALGIIKLPSKKIIYQLFSFAGAIMLSISFLELIPESINIGSVTLCIYGLIVGFLLMYLIDCIFPKHNQNSNNMKNISLFLSLGIAVHNIAEGMAVGISSNLNTHLSFVVAIGIAIHNIAEGICTSAPLFYCYKNKLKAFAISASTAIPLLIGYIIVNCLFKDSSSNFHSFLLAITAGLMIYISVDELIPNSASSTTHYNTIYSFLLGILLVICLGCL